MNLIPNNVILAKVPQASLLVLLWPGLWLRILTIIRLQDAPNGETAQLDLQTTVPQTTLDFLVHRTCFQRFPSLLQSIS